jgi:hypothetical protein
MVFGKLRKSLARRRMKARVAAFGNNQPAAINRHYRGYHAAAKRAFDARRAGGDETTDADAARLERDGFLVVPPSPVAAAGAQSMKARIDEAFEDAGNCYPLSGGAKRLIDGAEMFPEVVALLRGRVEHILERYFQSHFKIFSASYYRTVPDDSVPESSFLWHFDNAPDLQLKAMIYLDDVAADTGAFRFKSKADSERARAAGFWHRDDYERGRAVFDEDATTHVIEGATGTVILFQPGRVVHKATAPAHGHRDVAVLVINPSKIYWREHLARHRHLLSTNAGLCLNLDTDQPENIGYRF